MGEGVSDFQEENQTYEDLFDQCAERLEHAFDFMEGAFGTGQEMVVFVTGLNTGFYSLHSFRNMNVNGTMSIIRCCCLRMRRKRSGIWSAAGWRFKKFNCNETPLSLTHWIERGKPYGFYGRNL